MHWSFHASAARKANVALAKFQEHFTALQSHLEMDFSVQMSNYLWLALSKINTPFKQQLIK